MAPVKQPLWFIITLIDCNGQRLAEWNYDEIWPVTPPRFTYPNESDSTPYVIQFRRINVDIQPLPAHVDLNEAIDAAVAGYAGRPRS